MLSVHPSIIVFLASMKVANKPSRIYCKFPKKLELQLCIVHDILPLTLLDDYSIVFFASMKVASKASRIYLKLPKSWS